MLQHRRGPGDPAWQRTTTGWFRGAATPVGNATLFVRPEPSRGVVVGQAWGPGGAWVLDQMPDLLGAADEPPAEWASHPVVDAALRAGATWRFGRTDLVLQDLVGVVIEQKVTAQEAFGSFRALVRRYGCPAPGPGAERGLMVPPDLEGWRAVPSWGWIRASVDHARAAAITHALALGSSFEEAVRGAWHGGGDVDRVITSVPGIGRWSAAELRQRALGDQDAVSFGDYHVAKDFGWAVAGREFSDEEMADFLVPWQGHRGRVVRLVRLYAGMRLRRGARMAPRTHLPGARRSQC